MLRSLLFFSFLFLSALAFSQEDDFLNADNPSQSEDTYILPKNLFHIENAFTFSESSYSDNLAFRYGVGSGVELKLSADFSFQKSSTEVDAITLTAKYGITEQRGLLPAISLFANLQYEPQNAEKYSTDFLIVTKHALSSRFSLGTNFGADAHFSQYDMVTELSFSLSKRINLLTEYFATFSKGSAPSHNLDLGLAYIFKPDIQFDFLIAHPIFSSHSEPFLSVGVSYRGRFKKSSELYTHRLKSHF